MFINKENPMKSLEEIDKEISQAISVGFSDDPGIAYDLVDRLHEEIKERDKVIKSFPKDQIPPQIQEQMP